MKVALIVLLVIIAVFVALMVTGSKTNAGGQGSSGDPDPERFNADDFPAVSWLGSALGTFSPKLTVAQVQPPLVQYNLQKLASYPLTIASDAKHKLRSAKFHVPIVNGQRCAHLIYNAAGDPPKGLENLKQQDSEKLGGSDKTSPKSDIAFSILSGGGRIDMTRNTAFAQACVVQFLQ